MAGCSVDTLEAQQAFADKHKLRYPLVADPDAEIARAFGAFKDDWKVAGRATVIIGEDGKVLKAYPKAPLSGEGHAHAVFEDLENLLG